MKKNILEIEIIKNEQNKNYFMEQKNLSLDELVNEIKKREEKVVFFKTIEEDILLLSGYIAFKNEKQFKRQVFLAGKAQVRI